MFIQPRPARQVQLLDAACRLIARRGIRRLRMEDLAREAGVSVGLSYRYFTGRDELLAAVLSHVASGGAEYRRRQVPEYDDPRSALEQALSADFADGPAEEQTARVWSELYAEALFDDGLRTRLRDVTVEWIDEIAGLLAACVKRPEPAVRPIAERLVATTDGVSGWWVLGIFETNQARQAVLAAVGEAVVQASDDGSSRP